MKNTIIVFLMLYFNLPPFGGIEGGFFPPWGGHRGTAQQLPLYTQYSLNDYVINPAVCGTKGGFEIKSDYRYQWAGLTDAPRTYVLSLNAPYKDKNMGVGGFIFSDVTGPTSRSGLNFSYAYHLTLTESIKLSLGLAGGLMQYNVDGSKIILADDDDPALNSNIVTQMVPDASFGVYVFSEKFYLGATALQLLQNKIEFFDDKSKVISRLKTHFYAMSGYKIPASENFEIEPSLFIKIVSPVPPQIDLSLKASYQKKIWLGGLFRTTDNAISLLAGYAYQKKIYVGYAYEMTTSNIKNYSSGTHEIMLGMFFPSEKPAEPQDNALIE